MYLKSQKKKTKLPPQVASSVTLALTLTNGERLIRDFSPNDSLWNVLQHWEKDSLLVPLLNASQSEIPLCVYGRQEISSEETLKGTTLLQLGICNGKAAIRYSTRPNIPTKQLHVGGILKPVVRPPSPEIPIQQDEPTIPETESEEQMEIETTPEPVENMQEIDHSQKVEDHTLAEVEDITAPIEKLNDPKTIVENEKSKETQTRPIPTEEITQHHVVHLNSRGDLIYTMEGPSIIEREVVEEESEEFFDLSVDELRKRMQDLQRECSSLQNAPLLTSELRQAQKEMRQRQLLERYPTTVLRVQFPDGLILQVPLPSLMILDDVKKEIVAHLEEPVSVEDFFLFTSPPKLQLNSGSSLLELGLSPSSVVYIGSSSNRCCLVQQRLRGRMSSQMGAMRDATQRLLRDDDKEMVTGPSPITVEDNRAKRAAPPPNAGKLPKWFKIK